MILSPLRRRKCCQQKRHGIVAALVRICGSLVVSACVGISFTSHPLFLRLRPFEVTVKECCVARRCRQDGFDPIGLTTPSSGPNPRELDPSRAAKTSRESRDLASDPIATAGTLSGPTPSAFDPIGNAPANIEFGLPNTWQQTREALKTIDERLQRAILHSTRAVRELNALFDDRDFIRDIVYESEPNTQASVLADRAVTRNYIDDITAKLELQLPAQVSKSAFLAFAKDDPSSSKHANELCQDSVDELFEQIYPLWSRAAEAVAMVAAAESNAERRRELAVQGFRSRVMQQLDRAHGNGESQEELELRLSSLLAENRARLPLLERMVLQAEDLQDDPAKLSKLDAYIRAASELTAFRSLGDAIGRMNPFR